MVIILCLQKDQTLTKPTHAYGNTDMTALKRDVIAWCAELGFQQTGIADIDLQQAEDRLAD